MAYTHDPLDKTAEMTANNAPSPNVASADSEYSGSYQAWLGFDHSSATNEWSSSGAFPHWLKYNFGSALYAVNRYDILGYTAVSQCPTDWKFQGSNDDAAWDDLDTRSSITGWVSGTVKSFLFANTTKYQFYRLLVSAGEDPTNLAIVELELFDGTSYTVPTVTTTDTPNAPSINTAFPAVVTTTDTANAPGYSIGMTPVSVTTTDTPNDPSFAFMWTVPTAYTIDVPNAPSISGAVISQSITFPNLSGRQVSLEFVNADPLGGSELYHIRLKLFKSNDRTDHYDDFPNMSGEHLGLEFIQSANEDLILAYTSVGMLRKDE